MTSRDEQTGKRPLVAFAAGSLFGAAVVTAIFGLVLMGRSNGPDDTAGIAAVEEGSGDLHATETAAIVADETQEVEDQRVLPYSIVGRVVDDHEQPVADATVRAFSDRSDVASRAESDEEGQFEIRGLSLGLYTVEAHAIAFGSAVQRGVTPGGTELLLRLEPSADLIGRVVYEGQGVADLSVFVGGPGLFPPERVPTDDAGYFQVRNLEGRERVELLVVGLELGSGFGTTILLAEQSQVEIELRRSTPLALEIRDGRTDAPIDAGIVSISADSLHVLSISERIAAGRAELRGLPAGTYFGRVRAPGYLPWEGSVTQAEPTQRVVLDPGATAMGRVVDSSGAPIEGARVDIQIRDDRGRRWREVSDPDNAIDRRFLASGGEGVPPGYSTQTGSDGRFEIPGLPRGHIVIAAEREGFEPAHTDRLATDGAADLEAIEIVLEPSQ